MSSSSENKYAFYKQGSKSWSVLRSEEFQEEEIWGGIHIERKDFESRENSEDIESCFSSKLQISAARMIPKSKQTHEPKPLHHSAPINIPDWSKIYGTSSKKTQSSWLDDDGNGSGFARSSWESDEEDEDYVGNRMPPHERIARRNARNQISSFSVFEGVGRTLKGRDLSRVRNAVLTETGFIE